MKRNIGLYSLYRIFSYDMFFYNVISFFYFTTVKGLDVSQILFIEALYPIYVLILQIPCTTIAKKLGAKNSIILGNLLWIMGFVVYIIAPNFISIIFADILIAIGDILKLISEPAILIQSLKEENKEDTFGKLEGEGVGRYYYIETITAVLAGFLFVINPYLPFILGALMCTISMLIASQFSNIKATIDIEYGSFKEYLDGLRNGIKNVIKKKRLQALILYSSVFTGIIAISSCYYKNFFSNMGMDTEQFGLIFALLTIIQGIACQRQYIVERRTKNKTLTWTALIFTGSLITIGILGISGLQTSLIIVLLIVLLIIQKIIEGTYQISIKKYMVSFTTPSTITNVLTSSDLFNNIGTSLILFFGAFILDNLDMSYGYIVFGGIGFIVMALILMFMRTRVGLKPEDYKEYSKDEI
jgi:MFS family permease